MNKVIGLGVALLVAVVLGGWWLSSPSEKEKAMMEAQSGTEDTAAMEKKEVALKTEDAMMAKSDDAMMQKDGAMMDKPMESAMMGGQYVAYDAAKLAFAKEGKVVLFFRASWCPTCRALDADIRTNQSQIPKNVLILDVDYDKSAELKKQYGVTYQHTLVQVDADGKMIAKWSGSEGLKELLSGVK
jgi:thiol-disulfide isomerase/thioredoxin